MVLSVFGALSIYRAYHFWVTGFLVSDEYGYITYAIQGNLNNAIYGTRLFFGYLNFVLFHAFGVSNMDAFLYFLPFYLFLWSTITVLSYYFIMRSLGFSGRTLAISLLVAPFLIVFTLLSVGFLTEPVGLAMAMLGILFLVKFGKTEKWQGYLVYPLLSSLAFAAARYTREPYSIFLVGGPLVVVLLAFEGVRRMDAKRRKKLAVCAVAVLMFTGPAVVFLEWPVSLQAEIGSAFFGFTQTVTSPVVTTVTIVTVQPTTVTTIPPSTQTITTTRTTSNTTIVGIQVVTIPGSTETITQTTTEEATAAVLNSRLVNTIWIFLGGIALGWGPILLVL